MNYWVTEGYELLKKSTEIKKLWRDVVRHDFRKGEHKEEKDESVDPHNAKIVA